MKVWEVAKYCSSARKSLYHNAVNLVVAPEHSSNKQRRCKIDNFVLASIVASFSFSVHFGAQKKVLATINVGRCRCRYVILFAKLRERSASLVLVNQLALELERQLDVLSATTVIVGAVGKLVVVFVASCGILAMAREVVLQLNLKRMMMLVLVFVFVFERLMMLVLILVLVVVVVLLLLL